MGIKIIISNLFSKKPKKRDRLKEYNDSIYQVQSYIANSVWGFQRITFNKKEGFSSASCNKKNVQVQHKLEELSTKRLCFVEMIKFLKQCGLSYSIEKVKY